MAFDFDKPAYSDGTIVSPSNGTFSWGCTAGLVTYLKLDIANGDSFHLLHLDKNTVPIIAGQTINVVQGQFLGRIVPAGTHQSSCCNLSGDSLHLHFSWSSSMYNLKIDAYSFDCGDMAMCIGVSVYNVRCNRKYLGYSFYSTNGLPVYNNFSAFMSLLTDIYLVFGTNDNVIRNQTQIFLSQKSNTKGQIWNYNSVSKEIRGINDKCIDAMYRCR